MLRFGGILSIAAIAFWIWALADVALTEKTAFRRMNKIFWFLLVLFAPTLGAIGWLVFGRPRNAGFAPGAKLTKPSFLTDRPAGPRGIEDSAHWNANTAPSLPSDALVAEAKVDFDEWESEFDKRDSDLDDED